MWKKYARKCNQCIITKSGFNLIEKMASGKQQENNTIQFHCIALLYKLLLLLQKMTFWVNRVDDKILTEWRSGGNNSLIH